MGRVADDEMDTGPKRLSIRSQLFLLVLAVILPAYAMLAWDATTSARTARENANEHVGLLAKNTSERLTTLLSDNEVLMQKIAARPLTRRLDAAHCDSVIGDYIALHPEFSSLSLRDLDGHALCSAESSPLHYSQIRQFPWFEEGLRTPGMYVSNAFLDPHSQRWMTALTYPVFGQDGKLGGMLVLPFDLLKLQQRIFRGHSAATRVAIADRNNVLLMRSLDAERLIGQPASSNILHASTSKLAYGFFAAKDRSGVPSLFAYDTVAGAGWRVLVNLHEDDVFVGHRTQVARSLSLAVAMLALTLLLAWRISAAIIRPTRALADTAARVADGDPSARALEDGPREVAFVARQFNTMLEVREYNAMALQVANARYVAMINASQLVMYEWDPNTDAMIYSGQIERILGYTSDEMTGGMTRWMELIHPADVAAFRQAVAAVSRSAPTFSQTYRLFRKDGACRTVQEGGEFIFDHGGQVTRMVGFVLDITESKMAEAEIRKLNATLEQRVAERTAQLKNSNRELQSFSYAVSHDLRAPLRGIDGWSLALLEDCAPQLDELGREYLGRVRTETQRMGRLIDDLLLLSRTSQSEMHAAEVDISKLAASIMSQLQARDPERRVALVLAPGLSAIGDAGLLSIALTNLFENAWKFTAKVDDARIEFGQRQLDGVPTFFVQDNGAGFDMQYAEKLFAPFQRMHKASEFPGTGIGLATVQRIVARHSGRIWAQAVVGVGSTFFFTLECTL